jgi:hypothetical protein
VHHRIAALLLAASALVTGACGEVARTGRSPAYLQVVRLEAASGAQPDLFGSTLFSDVLTLVRDDKDNLVPTIFADLGRVEFRVSLKDPGPSAAPTTPSTLNAVTLSQYRVVFKRSDGRNTQGVDVPYAGTASGTFAVVRHQAKQEPPLRNMANNGGAQLISTVAELTFYGKDQAGNDVVATATMSVNFGDFGDPR